MLFHRTSLRKEVTFWQQVFGKLLILYVLRNDTFPHWKPEPNYIPICTYMDISLVAK